MANEPRVEITILPGTFDTPKVTSEYSGHHYCASCGRPLVGPHLVEDAKYFCNSCLDIAKFNKADFNAAVESAQEIVGANPLVDGARDANDQHLIRCGNCKRDTYHTKNINMSIGFDCGVCGRTRTFKSTPPQPNGTTPPQPNGTTPPKQEMVGGLLVSTDTPHFHLIPRVAMDRLAGRFMYGEKTKGKDAWNALSANQEVLLSREALARRLGHVVNHCYSLLDKLAKVAGAELSQCDLFDLSSNDDDAAAIAWGGMYAICATDAMKNESGAAFHVKKPAIAET